MIYQLWPSSFEKLVLQNASIVELLLYAEVRIEIRYFYMYSLYVYFIYTYVINITVFRSDVILS